MPLNKRQSEIITYLQGHIQEHSYAPSFEEIAERFGFQSLATVHEHLTNLERKGYIRRSYNESRSIEVLPPRGTSAASEIPLLGKVAPLRRIKQEDVQAAVHDPDVERVDSRRRVAAHGGQQALPVSVAVEHPTTGVRDNRRGGGELRPGR